jgi:hypothetical protein
MYVPKPEFLPTSPVNPVGMPHTNLEEKIKNEARKNIYIGLGLIVASIIITVLSYRFAKSEYFIFWGPALIGTVIYAKGVYAFSNPYSAVSHIHIQHTGLTNQHKKGVLSVIAGLFAIYIAGYAIVMSLAPQFANQFKSDGGYTKANYTVAAKKACVDGGGNDSYCACVADYMVNHYSLERLRQIDKDSSSNSLTIAPEIKAAARSCLSLYKASPSLGAPTTQSI